MNTNIKTFDSEVLKCEIDIFIAKQTLLGITRAKQEGFLSDLEVCRVFAESIVKWNIEEEISLVNVMNLSSFNKYILSHWLIEQIF